VSEYEFSAAENRSFARLVIAARVSGLLELALALAVLAVFAKLVSPKPSAALSLDGMVVIGGCALTGVFGTWKLAAATQFRRIVITQGSDVSLLMNGFTHLARIYRTQWLVTLGVLGTAAIIAIAVALSQVPIG
jgi:hypothetical protein